MDEVTRNENSSQVMTDYFHRLSYVRPWHSLSGSREQLIILLIGTTFVSLVACILICLICSQSPLRRRYPSKKKIIRKEDDTLILPPTPPYESIIKEDQTSCHNKLNSNAQLYLARKSFYGTTSNANGIQLNNANDDLSSINEKLNRSQSVRSTLSNDSTFEAVNDTSPSLPYVQIHIELHIDIKQGILIIHLTNGEHFRLHPAFQEQAEFFIHVQLLNNKILQKFRNARQKHRSNLQLSTWKNQQEKTTKRLLRTSSDTLLCDEYLRFLLHNNDIKSLCLRLSIFCIERSGIQDLMFDATMRLDSFMIPHHEQIVSFKDFPDIAFGEILLGISYLPTATRFTVRLEKLRYFFKKEKDQMIDVRLITTFFHHGRRFFQKKLPSFIYDESFTTNNNIYEINNTITQNIPQNDIQSIYVHFELIIHISSLKEESIMSCGSILIGEHTRYETLWQAMLEQPRQIHLGWYQFFG